MALLPIMSIEEFASIGMLVANAVFIIISVATYLRMNAHEQQRQQLLQLKARLERSLIETGFIEDHLLVLDKRERSHREASYPNQV